MLRTNISHNSCEKSHNKRTGINHRRLTHLSLIIPFIYHFLSQLRELHSHATQKKLCSTHITDTCIDDLSLMLTFLENTHNRISMNVLAYQCPMQYTNPTHAQLGLVVSASGFAWRYYLPPHLLYRTSNNLLKHIAAIIMPWIDILARCLNTKDSALSMTDSTMSKGWLRNSNFSKDDNKVQAQARIQVAREHTSRYMTLGIRDYSQWFPGKTKYYHWLTFLWNFRNRWPTHLSFTQNYPRAGSLTLQNCTSPQRNQLLADITTADATRQWAVQRGTHADHACSWSCWEQYCSSIGLGNDLFLDTITKQQRPHIIGAFGSAIQEGQYLQKNAAPLASLSVQSAISHVAVAFRQHGKGTPHTTMTETLRGY